MRMNRQHGLSIVELLISLVLGLVLVGGVISVFIASEETNRDTMQQSEIQENARFALGFIASDVKMAGFLGQFTGNRMQTASNVTFDSSVGNFTTDCSNGDNNASLPNLNAGTQFYLLWATETDSSNMLDCITDAKTNTGLLQFKRFFGEMATSQGTDANGVLNNADINKDNRIYALANANSIAFFQDDDGTMPQFSTIKGGEVWQYQHRVYFIANTERYGATIPVLKRKVLKTVSNAPRMESEELVEGIEDIRFMIGLDTNGSGAPNRYVGASDMTSAMWQSGTGRIVSIKIYVLARAISEDSNYINSKTYDLGDVTFTAPDDHFRRLLLVKTVALRNKM